MPVEEKHLIILAKDLHISVLLFRHVHQKVGHGVPNHMLSKLRERYWIDGVGSAIKRVLARCITCRCLNALPVHQQMADSLMKELSQMNHLSPVWELTASDL